MESRAEISVSRHFATSCERVFDAWLTPAIARQFLFTTPDSTMIRADIDAHVGGKFCFIDQRDGKDIEHIGQYLLIDRPRQLIFTFAVPEFSSEYTRVDITINAVDKGCDLILTHTGVLPDYAERTRAGWSSILSKLDEILKTK